MVGLNDADGAPLPQLAQVIEHYMRQSEQLETRLVLAADAQRAAGLLIQRLPVEGQANLGAGAGGPAAADEAFNRIAHLAATLSADELLTLDADTVLRRLFWEEDLRRFAPLRPQFACRCSRERVRTMLQGLGAQESEALIEERGEVEVGCEFCGQKYRFDAVDVAEMHLPAERQAPGSARIN